MKPPPVTCLSSRVVCHMRPECFSSLLSLRYNNLSSDKRWLKMFILTIYPTPNWHQRIKMRVSVFLLTLLLTFIEYWLNIIFPKMLTALKYLSCQSLMFWYSLRSPAFELHISTSNSPLSMICYTATLSFWLKRFTWAFPLHILLTSGWQMRNTTDEKIESTLKKKSCWTNLKKLE